LAEAEVEDKLWSGVEARADGLMCGFVWTLVDVLVELVVAFSLGNAETAISDLAAVLVTLHSGIICILAIYQ